MEPLGGDGRRCPRRIRRRFHTVVDGAGLDEARARDWAIVRMVIDASWTVGDARAADRRLTADEQERITCCVAIVKRFRTDHHA